MTPVNLDAMDEGDLRVLSGILKKLAGYAFVKANAMRFRKTGNDRFAEMAESKCQEIYQSLPRELRW